MPFTDDDLKRWQGLIEKADSFRCFTCEVPLSELQGFIARLEAAELLAECLSNHEDLDPVEVTEIGNWRRAAGRV